MMEKRIEVSRNLMERLAGVVGPNSASAKLLKEADEFMALSNADGHYRHVRFFRDGNTLILEKIDLGEEQMGS